MWGWMLGRRGVRRPTPTATGFSTTRTTAYSRPTPIRRTRTAMAWATRATTVRRARTPIRRTGTAMGQGISATRRAPVRRAARHRAGVLRVGSLREVVRPALHRVVGHQAAFHLEGRVGDR